MRASGVERLAHLGLIGLLMISGLLMAVAMIPLILLILAGIALFSLTNRHSPRELTRRATLGAPGNTH